MDRNLIFISIVNISLVIVGESYYFNLLMKMHLTNVLGGAVCQSETSKGHQRKEPQLRKCLLEIQL